MLRAATGQSEVRRVVFLSGKLDDSSRDRGVVAVARARCRKDQVRITKTAVGVLLSIDDVEVSGARRFDADAHPLSFADARVGFDSLGGPFGALTRLVLQDPRALVVSGLCGSQSPYCYTDDCFGRRSRFAELR